ncbi:enhancer of rudimentary homolog [Nicotiana tabacum]|uniref:Enhancer of rudimentary homolog n=3 Tax=Nicotiana TaxID=4085 RepID=A0A1S4C2H7_TOBAC|nr:PREDICTED: enhancer of rudimentary homolog [Nicotiana sylvestris]XP_016495264.1 PREDICTED: enhancer of rudimentary homolog [Nicotiana tabacum]
MLNATIKAALRFSPSFIPAAFSFSLFANSSKYKPRRSSFVMANRHTIILMQTSQNRATRTFMDYESISQAMDGICALYERKLKELNPAIREITYDISDLYNFIDGLADMSALVYDHSLQAYLPYDRQWIKQKTLQHLKRLASH